MALGYPVTVIDNFFEEPDAIVELADSVEYTQTPTGNYPGKRSKPLQEINERLFMYLGRKIYTIFQVKEPEYWEIKVTFQKIKSFYPQDQYNLLNKGWIHTDNTPYFGGVIYLDKNPEPDTGTSIYKLKKGYTFQFQDELMEKQALYTEKEINIENYNKYLTNIYEMYEETVRVSNVYNRFVLFDGNNHHGAQTYGTKERLTLNFFGTDMQGYKPPLMRGER